MKYNLQRFDLKHNLVDDKTKPKLYKPITNKLSTTNKQLQPYNAIQEIKFGICSVVV